MRRREILVFTAAFVVVLLGGAALAQVGTFSAAPSADAAALSTQSAAATSAAPTTTELPHKTAAVSDTATEPAPDTTTTATPAETEVPEPEAETGAPETKEAEAEPEPDTTPPALEILSPDADQHFEESVIAFEGKTEPGARVTAGDYEADVDSEGHWRIVLVLSPGGNVATFTAEDAAGNKTDKSVKVYYDVPETPQEFTAHQKWEVVDGSPAKNKYYGTGSPGTKVWVGSEYGNGSGQIGDSGEWGFYVEFPNAPCNQLFQVVVESQENRREFTMKYACAEKEHEFSAHQEHAENTSRVTEFYGTGVPGDTIWAASEYGTTQTNVGSDGKWALELHFNESLPANEKVGVVIESSHDNRVEFSFKWVSEDEEVEFTAHQKYGSCDSEVPWDKFWGTAQPGAVIEVASPYGSGRTTADASGNWSIEVEFAEAPVAEEFTVVVESSDGSRATFGFVRLAHEE